MFLSLYLTDCVMTTPNNLNKYPGMQRPINYINIKRHPEGGFQGIQIVQQTQLSAFETKNDSAVYEYSSAFSTPQHPPMYYLDNNTNRQLNSRCVNSQLISDSCSEDSKHSSPKCSTILNKTNHNPSQVLCSQTPQRPIVNKVSYSPNNINAQLSVSNDPRIDFYENNRPFPGLPDSRRVSVDSAISDPLSYSMPTYGDASDPNAEVNELTERMESEMRIYRDQMQRNHKGSPPPYSAHILKKATYDPYNDPTQSRVNGRQLPYNVALKSASVGNMSENSANNNKRVVLVNPSQNNNFVSSEEEYYGLCTRCQTKIVGRVNACQAMKKLYHTHCFTCSSCGRTLRGKTFYNIQDKIYCEEDYLYSGFQQTAEKCGVCGHLIVDMILQAMGQTFHPGCFRCSECRQCLDGVPFTIDIKNKIYCIKDYHRIYAPRCAACHDSIMPVEGGSASVRIVSMDKDFHVECYKCQDCGLQLSDEEDKLCYPLDNILLCRICHCRRIAS